IPLALLLRGPLDADITHRCVREVVTRHEILRTTFVNEGGVPRRVVSVHAEVPIRFVDLSELAGAPDREARLEERLSEEAAIPFDLATGPLFRVTIFRLAPEEQIVHLTMHHIVS